MNFAVDPACYHRVARGASLGLFWLRFLRVSFFVRVGVHNVQICSVCQVQNVLILHKSSQSEAGRGFGVIKEEMGLPAHNLLISYAVDRHLLHRVWGL